jgi:hypothetical protein
MKHHFGTHCWPSGERSTQVYVGCCKELNETPVVLSKAECLSLLKSNRTRKAKKANRNYALPPAFIMG